MTTHATRLTSREIKKTNPAFYAAVNAMGETAESAGLEKSLLEMTNLRASQINGCAYCVNYHSNNLREFGIPQTTIDLVSVWEEAGIFSEREQAAFIWTEALTLIAESRVKDAIYASVAPHFSADELIALTASISTINVWNRLSVSFRFPPEI